MLTGLYTPVPLREVADNFDLLARAKAIVWNSPSPRPSPRERGEGE
jgi:hypothetical protein